MEQKLTTPHKLVCITPICQTAAINTGYAPTEFMFGRRSQIYSRIHTRVEDVLEEEELGNKVLKVHTKMQEQIKTV
jgi:hypothetical protein